MKRIISSSNGNSIFCTINMFLSLGNLRSKVLNVCSKALNVHSKVLNGGSILLNGDFS